MPESAKSQWLRWVFVCTLGEVIGLLLFAWPVWILILRLELAGSLTIRLFELILMILLGVAEGLVMGWFQWQALRRWLPALTLQAWLWATVLAASLAWLLGSLPTLSFASRLVSESGQPYALLLLWSGLIGLIFGGIFGIMQWLELRHHSTHAGLWIPANAIGWSLGLMIISLEATLPLARMSFWETGASLLAAGLAAGVVIGGVTGWGLLTALRPANPR